MKKLILRSLFILILLVSLFSAAIPAFAATDQDITVTATPAFVGISNAPGTWTINEAGDGGDGFIIPSTTYYSNPLGTGVTAPSATVLDAECDFTLTNTSTIATDLTVNFPDHTGGDASTNGSGTPAANAFASWSYFSGDLLASAVQADDSGSGVAYASLGATTNILWGIMYSSQTGAWTAGTSMTSTVNIAAVAS